MAAFKSKEEEMYADRAKGYKALADQQWAMAKNGQVGSHYAKAREFYKEAAYNTTCTKQAHNAARRKNKK